jgi:hypothetical protein
LFLTKELHSKLRSALKPLTDEGEEDD